jgi:hypothetical protein
MALVTTTVSPQVRITPFTGLSETQRERSGIARAEVVYSADGLWPATGAGDTRGLIFSWDLDPDYGHVLMDCSANFIIASQYLTMEATSWMEIETETANDSERQYYPLVTYPSRQNQDGVTPIGDIQAYNYNTLYPSGTDVATMAFSMPIKPTGLLWPFPGVGRISCATVFGEQVVQEPQYAFRYYCRFLQYDIVQGYNYVVNSPVMTR